MLITFKNHLLQSLKIILVKVPHNFIVLSAAILILASVCCTSACPPEYPQSPEGVVNAFLKEDFTRGPHYWERISRFTNWVDGPGWDETVLVNDYSISSVETVKDIATVEVVYKKGIRLHFDEIGPVCDETKEKIRRKFVLVKVDNCWKIQESQEPPHLNYKYLEKDFESQLTKKLPPSKKQKILKALKTIRKFFKT